MYVIKLPLITSMKPIFFPSLSVSVQISFRLPTGLVRPIGGGGVPPAPTSWHLELSAKLGRFLTARRPGLPRRRPEAACQWDSAGRVSAISDNSSVTMRKEEEEEEAGIEEVLLKYEFQVPLDSEPGTEEIR